MWAENMGPNTDKVISIAQSQFASIRQATGKLTPQNTNELLHIPCTIKVAVKTDPTGQYEPQNEVKSVKAIGAVSSPNTNKSAPANNGQASSGSGGLPWKKPA